MKTKTLTQLLFLATFILLTRCASEDTKTLERATSENFTHIRTISIEGKTQNFQFNTNQNGFFTTQKGVQVVINANCLTKNGIAVSGIIDVELIELFERGAMLTTNKPTLAKLPNEDMALLVSGGEFYINATHQGEQLETNCAIQLIVPSNLTNGADNNMTLFCGNGWDNDCDGICNTIVVWEEIENGNDNVIISDADLGVTYIASFSSFGWTNIDKFYSDPRQKTTLSVNIPNGFTNTNSAVYIAYKDQPNALAHLDTFNISTGTFSERYGQIPIGLECHVIFVSETNGKWLYAIKDITISNNVMVSIEEIDLNIATQAELETLINNLP